MTSKEQSYQKVISTLSLVLESTPPLSFTAKMSTISSVLHTAFPHWVFCGFYSVIADDLLEIGPYQGHVMACTHIQFGKGVCGTVASTQQTIIVNDVLTYPNYIACDADTKSEIVVPVFNQNSLLAVLDIDGQTVGEFDEIDQRYLEEIVTLIQ